MRSTLLIGFALVVFAGCGAANQVPQPLAQIEAAAEDAYDKALLQDTAAVAADRETLSSTWASFRSQAIADGAKEQDAKALDDAISALKDALTTAADALALARKANALSAPMDELYAVYDPKVPARVLALDYLGREIVLDAKQNDLAAATSHIDSVQATWGSLRAGVIAAGGKTEASRFDASIQAERDAAAAADAGALVTQANAQLELVDAIEGVFERADGDPPD